MRAVRHRVAFAVVAALSLVAAACGDDDDDSDASVAPSATEGSGGATTTSSAGQPSTSAGPTTTTQPDDMDPNGILKYGRSLIIGPGVHFDVNQIRTTSNMEWLETIFGTLVRQAEDGSFEPWMAEKVEVVDPQTVRIVTRRGVTFTDGAAYDALAVKTSLERLRFQTAFPQGLHSGLAPLVSVTVIDPMTAEVKLDKPVAAVFIESLASLPGIVYSPKQIAEDPASIDTKPIGAGPYTLERFVPDSVIEVRKNPDFWDADSWELAGIDFVHTPNGPPQDTGMLSGTIDFALGTPIESVEALKADGDLTVQVVPGRFSSILLCGGKPPFDNADVRKALTIGIDREEYNELVYRGLGEPAYGFYRADHPSYDPEAEDLLAYDPDEAKRLIAGSGVTDVSWELVTAASINYGRQMEAIQAQLAKIGMNITVSILDNVYANWIEPQKPGGLIAYIVGQPVGGWLHYTRQFVPGQSNAFCGNDDPAVMEKVNAAAQLAPDDPKAIELYREANLMMVENALTIPIVFEPYSIVWNDTKVGGEPKFATDTGQPVLQLDSIYIKK